MQRDTRTINLTFILLTSAGTNIGLKFIGSGDSQNTVQNMDN
jgi:hypothetical protein